MSYTQLAESVGALNETNKALVEAVLEQQNVAGSSHKDYDSLRNYTGNRDSVIITDGATFGLFFRDPSDTISVDNGGTTIVTVRGFRYKRAGVQVVTPMMFGAKDSKTENSTDAVRRMLEFANKAFIPVSFVGMKSILLDNTADLKIRVSFDQAGCVLYLAPGSGPTRRVYDAVEDEGTDMRTLNIQNQANLTNGAARMTFTEELGSGFIYLNSTRQVNPRILSGVRTDKFFRQCFTIDRDGVLNEPLEADFTTGSEYTIQYKPFSDRGRITIRGITVADDNVVDENILQVSRSLVNVEDCSIIGKAGTRKATLTSGIFTTNLAGKVNFIRCFAAGRPADTTATYVFSLAYSAEVTLTDCGSVGMDVWGSTLATYTNGVVFSRCRFKRFDAHEALMNWDVLDCESYYAPIQYGFGYGRLRVRNHTLHQSDCIIKTRSDYGGDFKGHIDVEGVTWRMRGTQLAALSLMNAAVGSVGYTIDAAHSISFKNITLEYTGATPITMHGLNFYNNPEMTGGFVSLGYRKPKAVTIEDIKAIRNDFVFTQRNIFQFGLAPDTADKVTTWNFSKIMSRGYKDDAYFISNNSPFSSFQSAAVLGYDDITVDRCPDVMIQLAKPGVVFRLSNIPKLRAVANWRGASAGSDVYISDSVIADTVAIAGMNMGQGEIGPGSNILHLSNVHVRAACGIAAGKVLQGVALDAGVAVTLPSGATPATAFTGWKSTSLYQ